ncbi:MAG: membrane protein insertase YidC [Gallionellales bacterium RIFCSPLOWO2_02_FULL_59_110]|nr:MAG: membrane protein insertase YidC [Gallionellales bacterium RIFCSPLOWO2_02_FULL_59_110]OGT02923.1 MAG: membrane protein insertase YidC [Gallionellales bacterium RIFCSPLOWO2_02_58_13]
MDIQRLFLFLIFVFSLGLVWDGWQRHQHPEQYIQQDAITKEALPVATPSATTIPAASSLATPGQAPVAQQSAQPAVGATILVRTDILDAEISTIGGDISHLALLNHPDGQDKNKPLILFHRGAGTHNYAAQSGLLGAGLPNHTSLFVAEQDRYTLSGNAEQVQVRLKGAGDAALKVTKIITFHKGSYLVEVGYELENTGQQPVSASSYYQLIRDSAPLAGSSMFLPTYVGAAVYTDQEKFQKVEFAEIEKGKTDYPKQADDGWIGILQHYFVAAWLPKEKTRREYFTRKLDSDAYSVGMILPEQTIDPGQRALMGTTLYVGPAQTDLDEIAPGLGLTVDYGWLTVLSAPLFWVMALFYDWTHNWGAAIILLTVLIKLLFFPLSAASYRSMAKMRVVAPKLEKIKQQCGSDREKLNRAMMELYKTEKINPLGGCLPVVVQIPVFIALYWAILASVELRYAPFFGWITDLSAADPYYILPLIMGASMVIQMRLNPKPPDPIQAKVMQIMPIAFSIIFFFFPAGLVLYSIVNNILSIGQQWYITRAAEDESKAAAAKR